MLHRDETYVLNLPVKVDSAASLCGTSLAALATALARAPCNVTLEQAAYSSVLPGLVADAEARGFALTAS